jgi:DNA polymerase-3 subunit delta'
MSFKDIKGQGSATAFLKAAIKSDKVSHAYLFTGAPGVGKMLTAVKFAKALNCLAASGDKPCEECVSCKKISSSNHPDVSVVGPDEDESSVKIEKVRQIIRDISLKPYEGRHRVFIIDRADSMTDEAQNAFLKTLEEPPKDSVLILVSDSTGSILSTIASRTQAVRFFPIGTDEVRKILEDEYKLEIDKAHILSRFTSGSLGTAVRLNEEDFFNKRARIIKAISYRSLLDSEFDNVSKSDFKIYLNVMLTYFRDILAVKAGVAHADLINIDRKDMIIEEAGRMKFEELDRIIKQVSLTGSFLDRNVNTKLAFSALGLSLSIS